MKISELFTAANRVLRNDDFVNYAEAEMLDYYNEVCERIHHQLVANRCRLTLKALPVLTTADGTAAYDLPPDFGYMAKETFHETGAYNPMTQIDETQAFAIDSTEAAPAWYSISLQTTPPAITFYPTPSSASTFQGYYWTRYQPETDVNAEVFLDGIMNTSIRRGVILLAQDRDEFADVRDEKIEVVAYTAAMNALSLHGFLPIKWEPQFFRGFEGC